MTTLNPKLETLAAELANVPFDEISEKISAVTDSLDDDDADAVVARAIEIKKQEGAAMLAEADALEALERLMRASGCPEGAGAVAWLIERGLIETTGDRRYRILKPGPCAQQQS